ncbi:MAG: YciI family protein [Kastovskya adunca ATA6-11-RM4]|jgi:hypothetical protein|nr:YciI family protein [Kastovskya adunca ATA6-11-RM4]
MNANRVETSKIIEGSAPSLRMQLYVVTSTALSLEAVKENLAEHRAYLRNLEEQNVLFGAGPLWTDDGQYFEGDGMLIYRAASVAEATAIAEADPMHSRGARTFKIRPWLLNDGSITIRVTLSEPQRDVF